MSKSHSPLSTFQSAQQAAPVFISAPAFVVLSDRREVDNIEGSERSARQLVRDLKRMGFESATFKRFESWAAAEAYADKVRGY